MLPIKSLAEKLKVAPSKLLMPMAFASLLGGTSTLIGTSTNIAGNSFLVANGFAPIGMFEFLPIGALLLVFATLFFATFGNKILKQSEKSEEAERDIELERMFYADFTITQTTNLVGRTIKSLENNAIELVYIKKSDGSMFNQTDIPLEIGDEVSIKATNENIKHFYHAHSLGSVPTRGAHAETELVEMMVLPTSFVRNSSIAESNFSTLTGLRVVGMFRKHHTFETSLKNVQLRIGDILIAEGTKEDVERVRLQNDFIILNQKPRKEFPHLRKGFVVLGIFILAILASAFEIMPPSIALLLTVLAIVGLQIIPARDVYTNIDWRLIIIIGGMSAFGVAVVKTGMDVFLANVLVENFSELPALLLMFIFMIVTVLLTQPMSNAAAALVVLPVALQTATDFGLEPRGFAIAIILSASISMITPFEPASLLVFRPGNYSIADFLKIGGVLTLLCLLIVLFMVNYLYFST